MEQLEGFSEFSLVNVSVETTLLKKVGKEKDKIAAAQDKHQLKPETSKISLILSYVACPVRLLVELMLKIGRWAIVSDFYREHGLCKDSVRARAGRASVRILFVSWLAVALIIMMYHLSWGLPCSFIPDALPRLLSVLVAQLFAIPWALITVFMKEFSEKYTHLNKVYDELYTRGEPIDANSWVSFSEDCLLLKMHHHESFYPGFRKLVYYSWESPDFPCPDCPRFSIYLQLAKQDEYKKNEREWLRSYYDREERRQKLELLSRESKESLMQMIVDLREQLEGQV